MHANLFTYPTKQPAALRSPPVSAAPSIMSHVFQAIALFLLALGLHVESPSRAAISFGLQLMWSVDQYEDRLFEAERSEWKKSRRVSFNDEVEEIETYDCLEHKRVRCRQRLHGPGPDDWRVEEPIWLYELYVLDWDLRHEDESAHVALCQAFVDKYLEGDGQSLRLFRAGELRWNM
ncbi:hypothetical protein HDV00_000045 [Rhizophlyctis rosea]|nr:hypothetical protein HDV00_000045 [Rhizophlyctis rosea]